jgi:hypothetical protein
MGAQNCWAFSAGMFMIMACLAFLYEDEVTIIKEFEDTCSSQMTKLGECLNPWGVSRGTILRCIIFIFFTWAITPDLVYGTTFYFYTFDKCGPLGCCTAELGVRCTVSHTIAQ